MSINWTTPSVSTRFIWHLPQTYIRSCRLSQLSHGSVWSLWSYGPLILQKWAKNVNKVHNFLSFQPIYLILAANMDLEWQVCKRKFLHGSFLSLRSYGPLILQNWPNMLVHKNSFSFYLILLILANHYKMYKMYLLYI